MVKFRKKILTIIGSVSVVLIGLSGCASEPEPDHYTDKTFAVMQQDIETTVCAVAGKTVMSQEDVDNFRDLGSRLMGYEGTKKQAAVKTADMLYGLADSWELTLGADLGEKNGEELSLLCEQVSESSLRGKK